MKVSDSDYARIYYRALKHDVTIANIVAPPAKQNTLTENPPSCNNSRTERMPSRDMPCNMYCFGCGKDDHMLRQCPTVNERIEKGHIKKDKYGVTIYFLFLSKRLLSNLIFSAYIILSVDP